MQGGGRGGGNLGQALTEQAAGDQQMQPLSGAGGCAAQGKGRGGNHANRGINLGDSSRSSQPRKAPPDRERALAQIIHKVASPDFVYGFFVPRLPGQSLCPLDVRVMGREGGGAVGKE